MNDSKWILPFMVIAALTALSVFLLLSQSADIRKLEQRVDILELKAK